MSKTRILVINPNSNPGVTKGIDDALNRFRSSTELAIDCCTLDEGPFGIESDADIEAVMPLLVSRILAVSDDYDAFVIACYSDPGLPECRAVTKKPVLGIHESAVTLSASYGCKFGVLALGYESIQRHINYVRRLGFRDFHAGERPLNISVDQAANDPDTLIKIIETGRELIDEDGAEMLILGCAGMAKHRREAQEALGVPVIDPVQAAVKMASQMR
jgi:allantoin racemase